jgi:hypothetical protein
MAEAVAGDDQIGFGAHDGLGFAQDQLGQSGGFAGGLGELAGGGGDGHFVEADGAIFDLGDDFLGDNQDITGFQDQVLPLQSGLDGGSDVVAGPEQRQARKRDDLHRPWTASEFHAANSHHGCMSH